MSILSKIQAKIAESYLSGFDPEEIPGVMESFQIPLGNYTDTDPDAHLYRSLSYQRVDRKLQPVEQEKLLQRSAWLYMANPMAYQAVNLITNYVVGDGYGYASDNDDIMAAIKVHWENADNQWGILQSPRFRDLYVFGEAFYPAFVEVPTGHTRIAFLDPFQVDRVETDPENVAKPMKVYPKTSAAGEKHPGYWVIQKDETGELGKQMGGIYTGQDTKGKYIGEIFYFRMNAHLSSSRGKSPLLSVVDWFETLDKFLFSRAENIAVANSYAWDVEVPIGWGKKALRKLRLHVQSILAGVSGGVFVHGKNIQLKSVFPDYRAADAKNELKMLMAMICAGLGIPDHMLTGQGEATNRATAMAMKDPTLMQFQAHQTFFKYVLETIISFHLDQIRIFSSGNPISKLKDEDLLWEITTATINMEDQAKAAAILQIIANSLRIAEESGWLDTITVAQVFAEAASQLGAAVDIAPYLYEQSDEQKKARWEYTTQFGIPSSDNGDTFPPEIMESLKGGSLDQVRQWIKANANR